MSLPLHRICLLSKRLLRLLKPRPSFLIFLFFLALSSVFWLFTTLNDYYNEEVIVPVRLVDIPDGVVITTDDYDTLHVMIHDKGYTLASLADKGNMKELVISFKSFARQADRVVLTSTELQKQVQAMFGSTTTVVSVKPDRMELNFCNGNPKKVPVLLRGRFTPSENHYLADTIISPKTVTVFGEPEVLSKIACVTTEDLKLTNFTDTVIREIRIKKIPGTRIEPAKVTVKFCPDILMEDVLDVPVTPINVPEGVNMKTFPSKVKVRFTTGASQYKKFNGNDFVVQVDYNEIKEGSDKCPLHLRKLPKRVTKATMEISQIDFLIEN